MQLADNPDLDDKALVQQGYDLCAASYETARQRDTQPELDVLIRRLPHRAQVLDIGCGAGIFRSG